MIINYTIISIYTSNIKNRMKLLINNYEKPNNKGAINYSFACFISFIFGFNFTKINKFCHKINQQVFIFSYYYYIA